MTNLPTIGKTATDALKSIGVTSLEQVSLLDKATLLKVHGMGPKAITRLEKSMADHNLDFQEYPTDKSIPKSDFAVICSLNCDNAPKRRIIRDYLIAAASGNQQLLEAILSDSFRWSPPAQKPLEGKTAYINTVLTDPKALSTLEIHSILTHGKEGSAHGTLTTKAGDKIYFSNIIRFKSNQKDAPISEITSFIIK